MDQIPVNQSLQQRLSALVSRMPLTDVAVYLLARASDTFSRGRVQIRKYYFVAQPVPSLALLPAHRGNSISVTEISSDDPVRESFPRPQPVISERFARGAQCFVAKASGTYIGMLWLQSGHYLEDEVRCRFVPPANAVWDFDVYVAESHRRGFAFARLWDTANAWMRTRHIQWTLSRISAFAHDSIASHGSLGIKKLGSAVFVRAGSAQMMISSIKPYVHLSANMRSIPEIAFKSPRMADVTMPPEV